jgi:hypothetical protein
MRALLKRPSSATLAIYVAVIDAIVWLGAIPFEIYCNRFIARAHHPLTMVTALLLANVLLLLLILSAAVVTAELVRRGFTRRVPVVLRSLSAPRSKRSAR